MDYLERGELRTKFIKPVYLDADRQSRPRSWRSSRASGGKVYKLDVWCEDENGIKVVDGDATVEVSK